MSNNNDQQRASEWFKHEPAPVRKPSDLDNWETWSCTDPLFSYVYDQSVEVYVIEGEAQLEFANSQKVEVAPGDKLTITRGAKATWTIISPITNRYKTNI